MAIERILLGLGNPGETYEHTRHNVGVGFLEYMPDAHWEPQKGILVAKTSFGVMAKSNLYFMNQSGKIVEDLLYLKLPLHPLYVIHDDLDLRLGEYKIQFGKGPQLHGGVNDIERVLGAKDFWRIRIGVDNREVGKRIPGPDYVLQHFSFEEENRLQSVFDEIAQAIN